MASRTLVVGAVIAAALCAPACLTGQVVTTGVDPRVELMSIIFRLAGSPEYSQCRVPAHNQAIERHFAPFRDHEAVHLARQLRKTDGVSHEAVMSMAVQIKDVESLAERVPFDRRDLKLNKRWEGAKARRFLEAARRFVADTRFSEFLKSQQPLYDLTNARLRPFVATWLDPAWFGRYFGVHTTARFIVISMLASGPGSFGAALTAEDGVQKIYSILGIVQVDSAGQPRFSDGSAEMMVHEFMHIYTGPLIDEFKAPLEKAGRQIQKAVRQAMAAQAYASWETILNESLVRACTARYSSERFGPVAERNLIEYQASRSFLWVGELSQLLEQYEHERESNPTLESFMPQVVRYFDQLAPRVGDMVKRAAKSQREHPEQRATNPPVSGRPQLR